MEGKERERNFDVLRLLSSLMVVVLHVSGGFFAESKLDSSDFVVITLYNSMVRCAVPVFIMLSGYFNLQREFDLKKVLRQAGHFLLLYLAWSLLYALWHSQDAESWTLRRLLEIIAEGQYHLWFLPALIYCYLLSPLAFALKKLEDPQWMRYIVSLFFIFGIMRFSLDSLLTVADRPLMSRLVSQFGLYYGANFFYYFILGYVLGRRESRWSKKVYFGLFVMAGIGNAMLTVYFSRKLAHPVDQFLNSFNILVFFQAICLFRIFCASGKEGRSGASSPIWTKLTAWILGVYLIHPIFVDAAKVQPFLRELLSPGLYVPLVSIVIFGLSLLVSGLCLKVPFLRHLFR